MWGLFRSAAGFGFAGLMLLAIAACDRPAGDASPAAQPTEPPVSAGFAGTAVCAECHPDQAQAWRGSHHDLAMAPATGETVLGDFRDATFEFGGVRSRFYRRDGRFLVHTEGADGELAEFEIGWTFGAIPLQQYLVDFPDGRRQALNIAWDSRPAAEGGQRWFNVYGQEYIPPGDELHWTGPAQNWNYMCADCHSTGYRKNYDAASDRFASTWAEVNVACEACHGPGSEHVARARAGTLAADHGLLMDFAQPDRVRVMDAGARSARIVGSERAAAQVEACGRCHARRAPLADGYRHGAPVMDSYLPALLTEPLYFPDGQVRDEVYVYGSFRQSRMYAAGVVCSDCHDPHSLQLRAPGDAVCAQCHLPDFYAGPSHSHHPADDRSPGCVDCHMPSRRYMVIDERADHSFRVPRPDLARALGVTDACAACHASQPAGWSEAAVRRWLGRDAAGLQQQALPFRAAQERRLEAAAGLRELVADAGQPAIIRATAWHHLAAYAGEADRSAASGALQDPDPAVRRAALELFAAVPPGRRSADLLPVLSDPVRAVRTEAARMLVGLDPAALQADEAQRLRAGLAEYVQGQQANLDRPEARLNLGNLYRDGRDPDTARRQYRAALALQPAFEPAYVNLADLLASAGEEGAAGAVIDEGLARLPESAALHHARGLHQVRSGDLPGAIASLARAVELAPEDPRFLYVYAVALDGAGRRDQALILLGRGHELAPADGDILSALVSYHLQAGRVAQARHYALLLRALQPDNPEIAALLERLPPGGD